VGGKCARFLRPRSAADVSFSRLANGLLNAGFESAAYPPWVLTGDGGALQSGSWNFGITAHTGSWFFRAYGYNTAYSGVLTQTANVPAGSYRAYVWSRVYHGGNPENSAMNRVGVDPTGGTDPNALSVVWSDWDSQSRTSYSEWREISTAVVASGGGPCTVFLQYLQQNPSYYHACCFDDARLVSQ
jgi:hypothetical protein